MSNPKPKNPWKGLDFYEEGEVLYGRNVEIQNLSQYIFNNTQTVLYGRSGIGKSSILNAGIFPKARSKGMVPVPIRLKHDNSISYLEQIKTEIKKNHISFEENEVVPVIDAKAETLWEFFHRHRFTSADTKEPTTPLLVFDQFEEIFTLQTKETVKRDFFSELADLLNGIKPHYIVKHENENAVHLSTGPAKSINHGIFKGLNLSLNIKREGTDSSSEGAAKYIDAPDYHIVFALREDFLSALELYASSIPVMRNNRFGLLPINEEQAADIIMLPLPGLVDKDVATLIIQKVTERTDFILDGKPEIEVEAAILSLYLSSLYDKLPDGDAKITSELVNTYSGHIIKDFYERVIKSNEAKDEIIRQETIEILEDQLLTKEGRRDNVAKTDLLSFGVSEKELTLLIDKRKLLRQFSHGKDMRVEYIHDILCSVVKERIEQRELRKQQEEERKRQEEEKQKAIAEEKRKREESERRAAEEKAEMEAEAKRVKLRNRKRLSVLAAVIIFLCIGIGAVYFALFAEYSVCYGNFTTKYGWPVGLGDEIKSQKDKDNCTVYYRLSREGWLPSFSVLGKKYDNPFTKVEIINWKGDKATNVFVESPVGRIIDKELDNTKAASFADLQERVSYWLFAPDDNGAISRKTAYSIDEKELYSEVYSISNSTDNNSKYVLWSVFKDKGGNQLQINDNGTDRIRYTVSDGAITGCSFFTELGTPQPNTSGDYGYSYKTDSVNNYVLSQITLDKFGDKIPQTEVKYSSFLYGRYTQANNFKLTYTKQLVVFKTQQFSDTIHISNKGTVDKAHLHLNRDKISMIYFVYDGQNRIVSKQCYLKDDLIYNATYWYSSRLDSVKIYNKEESPSFFTEKYRYPKKNIKEISFWHNGQGIMRKVSEIGDSITYHKKLVVENGDGKKDTITTSYFDLGNALTSDGEYARSMIIKDKKNNNILYEYYYNKDGDIYKSEMFTYNGYGIKESKSVAGIDGTPVRCPNWDLNDFCYYKMKFITIDYLHDGLVALKGIDELGGSCPIMNNYGQELNYKEMPAIDVYENVSSSTFTVLHGVAISKINLTNSQYFNNVPFIHLLNKRGSLYHAVLCNPNNNIKTRRPIDGDIIVSINNVNVLNSFAPKIMLINALLNKVEKNGGKISVYRFHEQHVVKLDFIIEKGELGAEFHVYPISKTMHKLLNLAKSYE